MTSTCAITISSSRLDADILLQYSVLPKIASPGNYNYSYHHIPDGPLRSIRTCMDFHLQSQYEPDIPVESYERNVSSTQRGRHIEDLRQQSSTSPLPQSQWTQAPSRPRDFGAFVASTNPHARGLDVSPIQRTQSIGSGFRMSAPSPKSATSKQRRRPRPLDQERLHQPLDHSLLYPQMSPYAEPQEDLDHLEFEPRSVSQPVTPGYPQPGGLSDLQTPFLPRAPTFPPAGERLRGRSARSANEAAFDDEYEFRLFVEATAGLGPVPSMDQRDVSPVSPQIRHQDEYVGRPNPLDTDYIISPLAATPTTMEALQHLAQMPQSGPESQSQSQTGRQQLQILESEFDGWLQAPSTSHRNPPRRPSLPHMSVSAPMEDWRSVPDVSPIDDELPDYASSQAQAQAAQRVEATRRAQELQRRWRESGSRTIRYA